MVITDNVLLSRAVNGQVFSVHLPTDLIAYIREIEALQAIGKVLYFNKPFLESLNISMIKHTSLAKRLLDPTKDSLQLHLTQDKSIFIKDAVLFIKNGTLRVQTPDGRLTADILIQNSKPISVSETPERLNTADRKSVVPYGYLCRGTSFTPLEVRTL